MKPQQFVYFVGYSRASMFTYLSAFKSNQMRGKALQCVIHFGLQLLEKSRI
jgi:hypothetical protein